MAFNNRRSWRLQFIDIDSSFVMVAADEPLNGYMVCRAPKGNQRATYFPKGSHEAIDALMGVGSADWPDLLEAKAFNAEYPLYISAPSGTSEAYPSTLGGFYFTKNGLYKFHNISNKLELQDATGNAFKVKVQPGKEKVFNSDIAKSTIVLRGPDLVNYVPDPDEPGFGFLEFAYDEDNYSLTITKNNKLNVTEIVYDVMFSSVDGKAILSKAGAETVYWGESGELWTFSGQSAVLKNFGFNLDNIDKESNPLREWIGSKNYDALIGEDNLKGLMDLLVNGSTLDNNGGSYSIPLALQDLFSFLVSIKSETYAYFMQKSQTEIPTNVRISMIGYDKYLYDKILPHAAFDESVFNASGKLRVTEPSGADEKNKLKNAMENNEYVVFYDAASSSKISYIGQYVPEDSSDDGEAYYENVTANFVTQYISCDTPLYGILNPELFHKIFYVESEKNIRLLLTEESSIALYGYEEGLKKYEKGFMTNESAPKNPNFNALTVGCSEEVYPGKTISGGEFTGSLDDNGKDTYGGDIYFPEILQDDDVSFLEVRVLKKFGDDADDLDENGFWRHKRVIDPIDLDKDGFSPREKVFTIEGSRYCSLLVMMNKLENKVGGVWRDAFEPIIREGLEEATLPEYDDVYVFMEPTGQESLKKDLAAISNANDLAAVISPKILVPNNRNVVTDQLAQRVVVSGRVSQKSNAQYAGEFEVYDSVTRKKYWCQPIGDVGCNIMRIIEKKHGGWAPAWYNISGDLGGQLKRNVLRSKYSFEDEALKTLDIKGINPIIYTSDDGLMIVSQKTTQDPNFTSDWSWLGHSLSFQLVKREIRDNVMRPQIMKPINNYWMGLRQSQVDTILSKRTGGSSPIWSYAKCDIAGQNNNQTKAQRNFVIKVDVRVYTFSETVTLILENLPQED